MSNIIQWQARLVRDLLAVAGHLELLAELDAPPYAHRLSYQEQAAMIIAALDPIAREQR